MQWVFSSNYTIKDSIRLVLKSFKSLGIRKGTFKDRKNDDSHRELRLKKHFIVLEFLL